MIASQRSLAAGEIAPSLWPRCDTTKYQAGARQMRNTFVMRNGGSASRPGTTFVAEVKDSTKPVRLIPFVFNQTQTYMLEFGDQYIRIYQNGSPVTLAGISITGLVTDPVNPVTFQTPAHSAPTVGQELILTLPSIPQLNGKRVIVSGASTSAFSATYKDGTPVSGVFPTATGGFAAIIEVSTPYAYTDLPRLQFVQSADVMTITHPSYPVYQLNRASAYNFYLTPSTFSPLVNPPTLGTPSGGTGTGQIRFYAVTCVSSSGEESYPALSGGGVAGPSASNPISIGWTNPVTGASVSYHNVYLDIGGYGVFGFIGRVVGSSYQDYGATPDYSNSPPSIVTPFNASGKYPSAVTYFQQRLIFANTNSTPTTVQASRPGFFSNFSVSLPSAPDDAVTFNLVSRQINEIRHILDIGRLAIFTSAGEWVATGDGSGALTPTGINAKQYSYNGSDYLAPIVIQNTALYLQARRSIVRDFQYEFQSDSYKGNDLTLFSSHLVDNYSIVDWCYQQIPHSIVWAVRSDGTLLGLTYVREQEILGWHRHDFTGGTAENVSCIPEGTQDAVYLVVKRTVNGKTVRYVERMASRLINDVIDYIGMDAAVTIDGRNVNTSVPGLFTLQLTGGTTWSYQETLTLVASPPTFAASDVGNEFQLTGSDGSLIRFTVTGFTDNAHVTGTSDKTVPASLRGIGTNIWARAVGVVTGLDHLEGKQVSVFADRFVVSSPNNSAISTVLTVTNGAITLDQPYAVIHVGLPFISDLETLDIDTAQGESLADKGKNIGKVVVWIENSRGLWVGSSADPTATDPLSGLTELKVRNAETMDQSVALATGTEEVILQGEWSKGGRVFFRQVDPVPVSILAVAPVGMIPVRGTY